MGFLKNATLTLFLASLITLALAVDQGVDVDIWNQMSQGVELTADCTSQSHDFGIRGAGTDVAVSFDLDPSADSTTHCTLSSAHGKVDLDVYDFNRDQGGRCATRCVWNVMDDGVHGVDQRFQREDEVLGWVPGNSLAN